MDVQLYKTQAAKQIARLQGAEIVRQDWQTTLSSAPGILQIMGECLTLAAVPSACKVCFEEKDVTFKKGEFPELVGASLPASVFQCCQLGEEAFYTSHSGMVNIKVYSDQILSQLGDIVELMNEDVPRASDTQSTWSWIQQTVIGSGKIDPKVGEKQYLLKVYVKKLEVASQKCVAESDGIQKQFEYWIEFTTALISCIHGHHSALSNKQQTGQDRIKQQELSRDAAMRAKDLAKVRLDLLNTAREDAKAEAASQGQKVEEILTSGISGMISNPEGTADTVFAKLLYAGIRQISASVDFRGAEADYQKTQKELDKQEELRQVFIGQMKILQDKTTSLQIVAKVLHDSLERLQELQTGVRNIAMYFKLVGTFIGIMAGEMSDKATDGGIVQHVEASMESLYPVIRKQAGQIVSDLVVMKHVTEAYTEISHKYILPGFTIINKMSLPELTLGDAEVRRRATELSDYNSEATREIADVVSKTQKGLRRDLALRVQKAVAPIFGNRQ